MAADELADEHLVLVAQAGERRQLELALDRDAGVHPHLGDQEASVAGEVGQLVPVVRHDVLHYRSSCEQIYTQLIEKIKPTITKLNNDPERALASQARDVLVKLLGPIRRKAEEEIERAGRVRSRTSEDPPITTDPSPQCHADGAR